MGQDGGDTEQVQGSKVHEGCRFARAERRGTGTTCSKKTLTWEGSILNSYPLRRLWGLAPRTRQMGFLSFPDPMTLGILNPVDLKFVIFCYWRKKDVNLYSMVQLHMS